VERGENENALAENSGRSSARAGNTSRKIKQQLDLDRSGFLFQLLALLEGTMGGKRYDR